jgi:hypothetical protein
MKFEREVSVNNIVSGKRHRVMSNEAVNAFVTEDIADNVLKRHSSSNS